MQRLRLTKRLQAIAFYLSAWKKVADIGTDHAYLPIYLTTQDNYSKIIATELNQGPLERASKEIESLGLTEIIELRQGNGLQCLQPGEVEIVVVAGMGGETIRDILAHSLFVANTLKQIILQPMSRSYLLRSWLVDNCFTIVDEELIAEDNRIYEVLAVEPGESKKTYSPLELEIGPLLLAKKHNLLIPHLEQILNRYQQIQRDLEGQDKVEYLAKKKNALEIVNKIEEMLRWLNAKQ